MAAGLKLARGLTLDPDYYGGGTFAWLAKKGWGKTYAARVLAEELDKAGVPFVVLDPMDAFWGLRAAADGSRGGLEVPIFGGPHGDAPLEPTAGVLMADLLVEEGISMVLSMKHFGARSSERTFAKAFLDRLYRRNEDLVHIIMDEADLFAPQKPQAGDQPLLGTTENIVRRGRNNGIGITMLTQRSAVLNKDVLTQVDGIAIGRMLGPNDRNAIDAWVGEHGDTHKGKEIKDELPELQTGECWIWVPEEGVLKKVTIREALTFDSSPTRKRKGTSKREPKKLTDIDLGDIKQKMAATIEKAEAEDPKKLQKKIRDLEKQLAQRPAAEAPEPEEVKVPVIDQDTLDGLRSDLDAVRVELADKLENLDLLKESVHDVTDQLDRAEALVGRPFHAQSGTVHKDGKKVGEVKDVRGRVKIERPKAPPAPRREPPPLDGELTNPEQRVLDAIAWWVGVGYETPTKGQVGFVAGYKVGKKIGGTYASILGALRTKGLIDYPSPSNVQLIATDLASPPDIAPTTEALQETILAQLSDPERRVLQPCIDAYPDALSKHDIGEAAGYEVGEKIGGTFASLLGRLRTLGLIDYPTPSNAVAMPVLFLEGS